MSMSFGQPPRGSWFQLLSRSYPKVLERLLPTLGQLEEDLAINLADEALVVLLLPLIEGLQEENRHLEGGLRRVISDREVKQTLKVLLEEMKEVSQSWQLEPGYDAERTVTMTSRMVIYAIHKRWCRIPPICSK